MNSHVGILGRFWDGGNGSAEAHRGCRADPEGRCDIPPAMSRGAELAAQ
jgi:hypothetical protein